MTCGYTESKNGDPILFKTIMGDKEAEYYKAGNHRGLQAAF